MSNQTFPGSVGALGEVSNCEIRRNYAPFGGWDTFVPMNGKPSADVVTVVRKKGWAARQPPLLGSAVAAGVTRSSGPRAHPGVYKGADTRRAGRNVGDGDVSRSPLRPATLENNTFAEKRSRTEGPERSFSRKTDFVSPTKRLKEEKSREGCDAKPSGGKDHGRRIPGQRNYATDANCHARLGKVGHARVDAEPPQQFLPPMSECPASPPRLSRVKDSKTSGLHASKNGSSFTREVAQTTATLGLSTPGHQRNKTAKVSEWEGPAAKQSSAA